MLYSASTNGFYHDSVAKIAPEDAIEISQDVYAALLAAQSAGLRIVAGKDGRPIAIEHPRPTYAEAMEALREQRNRLLMASDFSQFADAPLTEEQREEWRLYRQALRDLLVTAVDPTTIVWPVAPSQ